MDNDLFKSCTSYTSCIIFGKKIIFIFLFSKAKKVYVELERYSNMVPKNTSHWKKKERASAMSKSDHRRWRKKTSIVKKRDAAARRKMLWKRREMRQGRVKSWRRRGRSMVVFTVGFQQIQTSGLRIAREKPHLHRTLNAIFSRN